MGGKARRIALSAGLPATLQAIARVLERHPGRGMVIGGIAVIARGARRLTRDVDVSLAGHGGKAADWVRELHRDGIEPRVSDAVAFAAESQVLLMRHAATGVDVDVSFATLPFEMEAIARASIESIGPTRLPIASAEDLVIYKSLAWRPQDQQDVERLLALHGDAMNLERVRRRVRELGEALEVARLEELEIVIRRVMSS